MKGEFYPFIPFLIITFLLKPSVTPSCHCRDVMDVQSMVIIITRIPLWAVSDHYRKTTSKLKTIDFSTISASHFLLLISASLSGDLWCQLWIWNWVTKVTGEALGGYLHGLSCIAQEIRRHRSSLQKDKKGAHTHILKQRPAGLSCTVTCELSWEKPIWTPQTAAASSFDGEASL